MDDREMSQTNILGGQNCPSQYLSKEVETICGIKLQYEDQIVLMCPHRGYISMRERHTQMFPCAYARHESWTEILKVFSALLVLHYFVSGLINKCIICFLNSSLRACIHDTFLSLSAQALLHPCAFQRPARTFLPQKNAVWTHTLIITIINLI